MSSKTFLLRTIMALLAVLGFAIYNWVDLEPFRWWALFLCDLFAMRKALYLALTKQKSNC